MEINLQQMKSLTVYRASAGSGKTFTLAAKYIALLLSGVSARSILAVTFTKKATAEMKERILSNLYALSMDPESAETAPFLEKVMEFMNGSGQTMSTEKVQSMAAKQLKNILDDYDHFTVTTIDAFLQMLLGEVARVAGLQTNFKVELNDMDVINHVIDKMMSNLEAQDEKTKEGIRKLILQNIEDEKNWDVRKTLKSLSKQLLYKDTYLKEKDEVEKFLETDNGFENYKESLKSSGDGTCLTEMKKLLADYDKTYHDDWECKNGNCKKWLKGFVKKLKGSLADEVSGDDYFKEMPTTCYNYICSDDFVHTYKGCGVAAQLVKLLLDMNELCGECRTFSLNLKSTTKHLGELSLINSISMAVDEDNREANRMLLSMTPILLQQILKQGVDTMFVLEKAGVRFSHVMIDEFQDTSHLQWENFLPLLDEIMSKSGTTLLVGDVKQSIYRFRGGDWEILKNIENGQLKKIFEENQGGVEQLTRNFRSEQNIVEFNMGFFPKAAKKLDEMYEKSDIQTIYDEQFEPEKLNDFCNRKEKKGLVDVRIYPFKNDKKADKNQKNEAVSAKLLEDMFGEIKRLLDQGMLQSDMMILLRKKKDINMVTSYLNAHHEEYGNLTLVSSDAYKLSSSVSVEMLVCALRYLNNPEDKVALVYLTRHYQNNVLGKNLSWQDFVDKPEKWLPKEFSADDLKGKPLYEMTEELMRLFLYDDKGTRRLEDDSYVFAFMDEMLDFLDDNASDLVLFLQYWDDRINDSTIPAPAVSEGIRVMTVHKVKGLEARTVFLPFCDWDLEKDKNGNFGGVSSDVIWCKPEKEPFKINFSLPITPEKSLEETNYAQDYAEEHYKRRIDVLNLLYVAFTRAKENLYVFSRCEMKETTACTTVGQLIMQVTGKESEVGAFNFESNFIQAEKKGTFELLRKEKHEDEQENRLLLRRENVDVELFNRAGRMKFRQSNRSKDFITPIEDEEKREQNEYIRMGNLCHQIFSAIRTTDDVDTVLKNLRTEGVIESDEREKSIRKFIENGLRNPQVKQWFDPSWTLFRECNILIGMGNGAICKRRPDRVMMRGEETVVIDYKFGVAKPDYEEQVREYMTLLTKMGRRNVKGFLWYVYEGKTVEVNPE